MQTGIMTEQLQRSWIRLAWVALALHCLLAALYIYVSSWHVFDHVTAVDGAFVIRINHLTGQIAASRGPIR
jgi:hypothetical protein